MVERGGNTSALTDWGHSPVEEVGGASLGEVVPAGSLAVLPTSWQLRRALDLSHCDGAVANDRPDCPVAAGHESLDQLIETIEVNDHASVHQY